MTRVALAIVEEAAALDLGAYLSLYWTSALGTSRNGLQQVRTARMMAMWDYYPSPTP